MYQLQSSLILLPHVSSLLFPAPPPSEIPLYNLAGQLHKPHSATRPNRLALCFPRQAPRPVGVISLGVCWACSRTWFPSVSGEKSPLPPLWVLLSKTALLSETSNYAPSEQMKSAPRRAASRFTWSVTGAHKPAQKKPTRSSEPQPLLSLSAISRLGSVFWREIFPVPKIFPNISSTQESSKTLHSDTHSNAF